MCMLRQRCSLSMLHRTCENVHGVLRVMDSTYKYMYPMGCSAPKLYGLPQIHKLDIPSGLLCSVEDVTYGVAKVLIKIPLVDKSPHHIHSTQDFVEQANKVTLPPGECLSSYDVTALFTSVPVAPALGIVKYLLEQDNTLKKGQCYWLRT